MICSWRYLCLTQIIGLEAALSHFLDTSHKSRKIAFNSELFHSCDNYCRALVASMIDSKFGVKSILTLHSLRYTSIILSGSLELVGMGFLTKYLPLIGLLTIIRALSLAKCKTTTQSNGLSIE